MKVADSLIQWYTGEDKFSDVFLSKVLESATNGNIDLAESIFATFVPTASLFSKAIVHIVDFFLMDDQVDIRQQLIRLAYESSSTGDAQIYKLACEALRE